MVRGCRKRIGLPAPFCAELAQTIPSPFWWLRLCASSRVPFPFQRRDCDGEYFDFRGRALRNAER
jgi:hypothetical protein